MASFNNTKGGDIEGQIRNNLAKPSNVKQLFKPRADDIETITLYYSCSFEIASPNIDAIIDYLNMQRAYSLAGVDYGGLERNDDRDLYQYPRALFYLAMDREGYEILAWSEEEDSVVRTPHKKGDA